MNYVENIVDICFNNRMEIMNDLICFSLCYNF